MNHNRSSSNVSPSTQDAVPGLDPEELSAERAGELPERDAMSILDVGGLEGGLPPAGALDSLLGSHLPVDTEPSIGLPIEQPPIDQLPIDQLPIDPLPPDGLPVDTAPILSPGDALPYQPLPGTDPTGIPKPEISADTSVKV
jgi:hypothetical protein